MGGRKALAGLIGVVKTWSAGGRRIEVLRGLDLEVYPGESLAVVGPSGAGKSTALHVLGLLTPPDRGRVFHGPKLSGRDDLRRDLALRRTIGFIFQDAKLIPGLNLLKNTAVPLAHRGLPAAARRSLAASALADVSLEHRLDHFPHQLSSGELIRAAIARALVARPRLILADEPTGSLDSVAGREAADLLLNSVAPDRALVMVTHQPDLAARADRVIRIKDGRLEA